MADTIDQPQQEDNDMCRFRNTSVKVLKKHENNIIGTRVELTRKMTIKGAIIYAVVVTNMNTGNHYKILTFDGIKAAFDTYKQAIA